MIGRVGADEERALAALVVRRERDELEDAVDVVFAEAGLEQALGRGAADEPLRARARVDAPRLDADDAAHTLGRGRRDPDQRGDLLRRELGHRRPALERVLRLDPHLGAQRAAGARRCGAAMCSASVSTRNASPITTWSIASPKSSGKRDMCTPFCAGSRSTVQEISAANVFSRPSCRMRIAFCTPVTPARVRPS